ncbi:hypothetical protein OG357_04240 [Streptomyces sp. NBC_01255]|uniref:hypothetical protein n=1 Tax=Streptomyces sp. NBC_01255 TaxID=2903798 RepID=UPI002E34219B|nr:hypothetical protein [Streptomyces sp. NBC_01255]
MKPTEEVLQELTQPSNISIHSDDALVGKVKAAIAADDKKRKENDDEPLRRKPDLAPIPQTELPRQFEVTLWDVLHTLARATALSWRGAGRGLAEHWGALKYTQALAGGRNSFLGLTDEGHRIADHYKSLQSGELGIGFALTLTEHMLGSHSDAATSAEQLASASAHAEAVHIGVWNETPGLLFSTQLPTDGGTMTVHALQALGSGGRLSPAEDREANLNAPPFQSNVMPDIHPPTEGLVAPEPVRGCHVQAKDYAWFQESLAHTTAAGLMAFTGSGHATARHLTDRQGRKRFTGLEHAASMSIQDAAHTLFGNEYVGTDHVFRLNGPRVEAFSGVDAEVFRLLARGDIEEYRALVHASRHVRPRLTFDKDWGGPVSVHADGSVLALRLLPGQDEEPRPGSPR